ncbi:hypothetical protein IWX47DRAFT_612407 [Phyllosticta citricarpa]
MGSSRDIRKAHRSSPSFTRPHPYLPPTRASFIASWSSSVPRRSNQVQAQTHSPFATDPAVQAYLQLKMAMMKKTGT